MRIRRSLLMVLLTALAVVPAGALAKGGPREVLSSARCGGSVTADLRLRAQGGIRVRLEVEHSRAGIWHVVLVHERRVAWRGTARGSFEVERSLPDYPGSDAVIARATGPGGAVCQLTGVISDVSNSDDGAQRSDG